MKLLKGVSLSKWVAAYFCAVGLLALAVHKPLPEGFTKSKLDRIVMHVVEPALRVTYYWPSRLFFSSTSGMVWWTRIVLNNLALFVGPLWNYDEQLHMETTNWEGVDVRVYSPRQNASSRGAVFFIHGGGFALGNLVMYESLTRRIAKMLNSVVVSVEYRLSPETPYPGGIIDCEKVLEYFISIAEEKYDVDPSKIVVMGDSAGGNLAAVITQRRSEQNKTPDIAAQVLVYPLLQMADLQSVSYRFYQKHLEGYALVDPESVVLYYMFYAGIDMDKYRHLAKYVLTNGHVSPKDRNYINKVLNYTVFSELNYANEVLPERAPVQEHALLQELMAPWLTNPEFSPLMRENLSGLPKAFIMTCNFDVLRDEGIMYAKRLEKAGVPVDLRNYENGFHAMLNFHREVEEASKALTDVVDWTLNVLRS
ncbi:unnamed protein product [Auanema sp. JU1783]|nr:unnamed protein product [Auanema sp. JU1783]